MKMSYKSAVIGTALLGLLGVYALRDAASAQIAAFTVVWALMGCSWNLISGYAGPISLGQGAFLGVTSFTSALLFRDYNYSPYIGIAIGLVVSVLLAAFIGAITLRLSGLYFALATLTIPLTIGILVRYFGYYEIPRPYVGESWKYFQFNTATPYFVIGALLVSATMIFTAWLEDTRMGRYFVAIRENEQAAEASGVPTFRYKMYAFLMAAVVASLAGGLYGQLSFVFAPEDVFNPLISVQALLVVLVGGPGTVLGPLLGAVLIIPGGEYMARNLYQYPGLDRLGYAVLLLVVAFWSPKGLAPYVMMGVQRASSRLGRKRLEDEAGSGARNVSAGGRDIEALPDDRIQDDVGTELVDGGER